MFAHTLARTINLLDLFILVALFSIIWLTYTTHTFACVYKKRIEECQDHIRRLSKEVAEMKELLMGQEWRQGVDGRWRKMRD
jgi:hypothetical protein